VLIGRLRISKQGKQGKTPQKHLKGKKKRSPRTELTANRKRDMVGQDSEGTIGVERGMR
jgi:hypothetical protein